MFTVVPYCCPKCKRPGVAPLELADVEMYCIDCGQMFRVLRCGFHPQPWIEHEVLALAVVRELASLLGDNAGPAYYRLRDALVGLPGMPRRFQPPPPSLN